MIPSFLELADIKANRSNSYLKKCSKSLLPTRECLVYYSLPCNAVLEPRDVRAIQQGAFWWHKILITVFLFTAIWQECPMMIGSGKHNVPKFSIGIQCLQKVWTKLLLVLISRIKIKACLQNLQLTSSLRHCTMIKKDEGNISNNLVRCSTCPKFVSYISADYTTNVKTSQRWVTNLG